MVIRQIQVLLVGLIAVSALQQSAFQSTQTEARLHAERLAKIKRSTAKAPVSKPSAIKAIPVNVKAVPSQSKAATKAIQRSKSVENPIQ